MSQEQDYSAELDAVFVADERLWQGQKIAPYTEGSRLLLSQVRSENDSPLFFVYSFLFLHLELARDRRAAIRLAWDRDAFREAVLNFSDKFCEEDRQQAGAIVAAMVDQASKARTEPVPSGKAGPPGPKA
jgi:hypothetical protein